MDRARKLSALSVDDLVAEKRRHYSESGFDPEIARIELGWDARKVKQLMLQKKVVNDGDGVGRTKPKRIRNIQFSILSGPDMERASELQVSNKQLYDIGTRKPVPFGCLDTRLGISDKVSECGTCGMKLQDCVGHFGHIELALPVYHIGYYKSIQNILQSICKTCGSILLKEADRIRFLERMLSNRMDSITRATYRKKILEACKKVRVCTVCSALNGTVKKVQGAETLKLVHEKYKLKEFNQDEDGAKQDRFDQFSTVSRFNPEIDLNVVRKTQEVLNPQMVLDMFRRIKDEDLPLLWADPEFSRPENMVMTHMLVPPVAIRPSVRMDTQGSNEDDLTGKLQEILDINTELVNHMQLGQKTKKVIELWNCLQIRVGQFINGELPGLPASVRREIKPIRGLVQRLKGKQGRFRGNLSGKRVDFSGRTVISPDPNLHIHQVGVPVEMAKRLTYPEVVNLHNIERLREMIKRGPDVHPGANFVRQMDPDNGTNNDELVRERMQQQQLQLQKNPRTPAQQADERGGLLRSLKFGRPDKVAEELKIGDIVERHLCDDDIVLFNRQPSLHKMSIMSHRAKVLPGRTLRFNECVCAPYNADFDGDEMNLHLPQTEEARAEADQLMGVRRNLITPRNGEPLVTATQDFITAAFLMTSRDQFFSKEKFCQVVSLIGDASEHIDIPPPAICWPRKLWTGKQVWNVLLRPDRKRSDWPIVSLETKERAYNGNDSDGPCMCPNEGYVVFRNSELLCGSIGKGVLGGSKSGLFYALIRDFSEEAAAQAMNRMTKVCSRWLSSRGFSIGLEDVTPGEELLENKAREINGGYSTCESLIQQFRNGTLQARPGCNLDESLESEVSGVLSRVRDTAGKMCMETLPKHNSAFIMATAGSKGSALNICQMMVCVGQQIVGGKRMPNGFVRRTLPHFNLDAKDPGSKGFVANSFYSGLTAPEFFFHTMGGREGLVDTAVKTAETGYMARRLMKALEDLSIRYDGSVRNATGGIVQFTYGDDGLNPSFMEKGDVPVNWDRLEGFVRPLYSDKASPSLSPTGLLHRKNTKFSTWTKILVSTGTMERLGVFRVDKSIEHFVKEIGLFIEKLSRRLLNECANVGVLEDDLINYGHHLPLSSSEEIRSYWKEMGQTFGSHAAWAGAAKTLGSPEYRAANLITLNNLCRTTDEQLTRLVKEAIERFLKARTEPGEAVGAIGAQSLGEPGTQMTLKTFHFAGVASMNVTLGVPRIKEIINASKVISTPIITVKLQTDNDERVARIVKGRLESTRLGEIAEYVEERYSEQGCMLAVKLAMRAIENLHLDVSVHTVREAILGHRPLKLGAGKKDEAEKVATDERHGVVMIMVDPDHRVAGTRASAATSGAADTDGNDPLRMTNKKNQMSETLQNAIPLYFNIQTMKRMLMDVIVQGIPTVQRAVVNHDEKDNSRYHLLVEGLGLQAVIGTPGVDGRETKTNHIMEMESVLGIEAARSLVMEEMAYIFGRYGLTIDQRHLKLLADVMSYRGQILGITRFGIAKMKESVLMLASFEKTADHLFDAAAHARKDAIDGVSECIIMGTPMPIGTGLFKLLCEWENKKLAPERLKPRAHLLFDGEG